MACTLQLQSSSSSGPVLYTSTDCILPQNVRRTHRVCLTAYYANTRIRNCGMRVIVPRWRSQFYRGWARRSRLHVKCEAEPRQKTPPPPLGPFDAGGWVIGKPIGSQKREKWDDNPKQIEALAINVRALRVTIGEERARENRGGVPRGILRPGVEMIVDRLLTRVLALQQQAQRDAESDGRMPLHVIANLKALQKEYISLEISMRRASEVAPGSPNGTRAIRAPRNAIMGDSPQPQGLEEDAYRLETSPPPDYNAAQVAGADSPAELATGMPSPGTIRREVKAAPPRSVRRDVEAAPEVSKKSGSPEMPRVEEAPPVIVPQPAIQGNQIAGITTRGTVVRNLKPVELPVSSGRVEDLIVEDLKSQLADKAWVVQNLEAQLQERETKLQQLLGTREKKSERIAYLEEKLAEKEISFNEQQTRMEELGKRYDEARADLEEGLAKVSKREDESRLFRGMMESMKSEYTRLKEELAQKEEESKIFRELFDEMKGDFEVIRAEFGKKEDEISLMQQLLDAVKLEAEEMRMELEIAREDAAASREELERKSNQLRGVEASVNDTSSRLLDNSKELLGMRRTFNAMKEELQSREKRVAALETEVQGLSEELQEAEEQKQGAYDDRDSAVQEKEGLEEHVSELNKVVASLRRELAEAQGFAKQLTVQLSREKERSSAATQLYEKAQMELESAILSLEASETATEELEEEIAALREDSGEGSRALEEATEQHQRALEELSMEHAESLGRVRDEYEKLVMQQEEHVQQMEMNWAESVAAEAARASRAMEESDRIQDRQSKMVEEEVKKFAAPLQDAREQVEAMAVMMEEKARRLVALEGERWALQGKVKELMDEVAKRAAAQESIQAYEAAAIAETEARLRGAREREAQLEEELQKKERTLASVADNSAQENARLRAELQELAAELERQKAIAAAAGGSELKSELDRERLIARIASLEEGMWEDGAAPALATEDASSDIIARQNQNDSDEEENGLPAAWRESIPFTKRRHEGKQQAEGEVEDIQLKLEKALADLDGLAQVAEASANGFERAKAGESAESHLPWANGNTGWMGRTSEKVTAEGGSSEGSTMKSGGTPVEEGAGAPMSVEFMSLGLEDDIEKRIAAALEMDESVETWLAELLAESEAELSNDDSGSSTPSAVGVGSKGGGKVSSSTDIRNVARGEEVSTSPRETGPADVRSRDGQNKAVGSRAVADVAQGVAAVAPAQQERGGRPGFWREQQKKGFVGDGSAPRRDERKGRREVASKTMVGKGSLSKRAPVLGAQGSSPAGGGSSATSSGEGITLFYKTSWKTAYIHYSDVKTGRWTTLPGVKMGERRGPDGTPSKVISIPSSAVEFVLTDGLGTWDRSPSGENFRINSQGVYMLQQGQVLAAGLSASGS